MNEFRRLLGYAAPFRGRLTLAVLAMVVYAAGSVGLMLIVRLIFDLLTRLETQQLPVVTANQVAVALIAAFAIKGLGAYFSSYLMTEVGQRVVMDLRNRLFRHMLNQSAAFFSRRTSGQLISRITNDVSQVQTAAAETVADLIRESITVVGYAALLFYLDASLAVLCVATVPLVVYPLVRLGRRVRSTTRLSQEEQAHLTHVASEGLTGHRIVKAFRAEGREGARFAAVGEKLYRTNMRITAAMSALPPLMEFIGGLGAAGAVWYASVKIANIDPLTGRGDLTTGEFMSFLGTAFSMYGPIKKLSRVNAGLQQAIAAAQRIFEMLDTHSEVKERPGAAPLPPLRSTVEFRDVGFAYDDSPDRHILRHVSFTARAGQVVALVGLSGAGKTTLVNLIPRFYDVTEGALLIDGVDVRDVTLASLRGQIALVTQENVLFDDTIATNIAYGAPDASRDAIEAAAKAAHAHDFILEAEGGYEARIGERGQRLSGGQRQRLAIARAILTNAPILVLDEATSALDSESEQAVQAALVNLMRDRTTFVIAHRLSTVRHADLIVALEDGQVAELGTHDTLIDRAGGVYARLHSLQIMDEREETH
ncbi:MAG TPA: ABC transporter transmembrane domain-containing protein [Vicinamibacterales bacterium]|nr:ABC transporter transmembrane domain-containing protein [Vicinamibacterales bacterium]